jgi:acetylornithine deacetylase/succinyl-diaminopimelate desuccinylase-like protein
VNLPPFLDANVEELRADVALICDTNMWDPLTPAITTSLRGLCGEEIVIHGSDRDLHSGFYGSAAANPNHVLARILADLRDADGRITLPGFYNGVPELPQALRDSWATLGFSEAEFLGEVGLSVPAGEKGRSALEMVWSRPTCEVNGMGGGYQGAGFKTVIPAEAMAKVSFRLVFDQDPHKIRAAFREFVTARVPADCRVEFHEHGSGRAVAFDTGGPFFQKTQAALTDEWARRAAFVGGGGSGLPGRGQRRRRWPEPHRARRHEGVPQRALPLRLHHVVPHGPAHSSCPGAPEAHPSPGTLHVHYLYRRHPHLPQGWRLGPARE